MSETIEEKCLSKGVKLTDQRKVIAQVMSQSMDHPDVDELYNRVSKIDPKISIATVYRTVKLFEEVGILTKHEFRGGKARYEEIHEGHHDHLIDIKSGEIIEFVDTGKFKLSVLENNYFLRDYDPTDNLQSAQKYFSNDKNLVDPLKGTEILNNSTTISQNNEFYFSNKEVYIYKTNGSGLYLDTNGVVLSDQNDTTLRIIKDRKSPGMWLDLKKSFFQQKQVFQILSDITSQSQI